jgi:plastocyanin
MGSAATPRRPAPQKEVRMFIQRALCLIGLSVLLASCGGGGGGSSPTSPTPTPQPQTVVIQVQDDQFSPKDVTINPGDTVRWVRTGSLSSHTATANDGSFDSGTAFQQSGGTFEKTFNASGQTYEYICKTHYGCCQMAGSIRVGSNSPNPHPGY